MDPALQDKQRQLKRAKLADHLNEKIAHRPGPLELVDAHILEPEDKDLMSAIEGKHPVLLIFVASGKMYTQFCENICICVTVRLIVNLFW